MAQSDIYWVHPSNEVIELVNEHNCIFNIMPGISGMAGNKRRLANIFKRLVRNHPKSFDFVTRTFCMPDEREAA